MSNDESEAIHALHSIQTEYSTRHRGGFMLPGKGVVRTGIRSWASQNRRRERSDILRIARSHGATNIRVFGLFARGTAGLESDLDLLIDLGPGRDLFDLIAIQQDLEDLLGRKVDVLTEGGLSRYIRDEVLREAVPL